MFLDPLFKLMSEKQASDLFLTAGAPIQIKINGTVMPLNNQMLDPAAVKRIAYEIMTEEQVARFEKDWEINFAVGRPQLGSFRVNVFRQRGATAAVVRFVKPDVPTLEQLRLPQMFGDLVMEKLGLILVVGSTGSGKSTTLASMIESRNQRRTGHILTIEDPIEYVFKHKKSIVNQREIGMDTTSYDAALTSAMREAPDLLVIGEIRDRPTLQSAMLFSQTGHLCLSTLHANNSYHALNRIINFFPREAREGLLADLAVSLKAVISQRLVRTKDKRRIPAIEILLNTPHIAELIKTGEIPEIKEAMEQSLAQGSQTFEQALYDLYVNGEITLDEAMTNSDSPTNLHWLINNSGKLVRPQDTARSAPDPVSDPQSSDLSSIKLNLDIM
jgi:twitching motility protein PilU